MTSNRSSVRGEDPLGCIELIWVLCCPIPSLKISSHRGVYPDDRALLLFRGSIAGQVVSRAHGQAICEIGVADPIAMKAHYLESRGAGERLRQGPLRAREYDATMPENDRAEV